MSVWSFLTGLVVTVAAIFQILDYWGLRPRTDDGGVPMPFSRKWKLTIMLGLTAISLGLSGYGFYRSLRPRIVERTVTIEKPVEKIVQAECPRTESKATTPKTSKPKRDADVAAPAEPQQTTINAPNGIGISGGNVEHPTVNNFAPPEPNIAIINNGCQAADGGFVCSVILKTDRAIKGNLAFTVTFDGDVDSPSVDIGRPAILTSSDVHSGEPRNAIAFTYNQPNSLPADGEIRVSVNSKVKVKAISVTRGS